MTKHEKHDDKESKDDAALTPKKHGITYRVRLPFAACGHVFNAGTITRDDLALHGIVTDEDVARYEAEGLITRI